MNPDRPKFDKHSSKLPLVKRLLLLGAFAGGGCSIIRTYQALNELDKHLGAIETDIGEIQSKIPEMNTHLSSMETNVAEMSQYDDAKATRVAEMTATP